MKIIINIDRAQSSFNETEQTYEIELTPAELRAAYEEQQHEGDKQDILNYIENYLDEADDELFAAFLTQHVEKAANDLREILDDGETAFDDARECVIEDMRRQFNETALAAARVERD